MKAPKNTRCTQRAFDQVIATIQEVGFSGLSQDEKDIVNASDAGTLVIIEPVSRSYNDMCAAAGERSPTAAY
jgi:hypothetical protein